LQTALYLGVSQHSRFKLWKLCWRKPRPAIRVDPTVETAVVKMAFDFPVFGQLRASNELRKLGIFILTGGQ
jgi:hypothetical protein